MNNSIMNTVTQQKMETCKRLLQYQAVIIPTIRAAKPDIMLLVAFIMAGNVITASVT
jgi:hypothetical protein